MLPTSLRDQVEEVNEPENKLTQNQTTSSVNAYDDVDSLVDFEDQEESDEELENLSAHNFARNRRKLRLLSIVILEDGTQHYASSLHELLYC